MKKYFDNNRGVVLIVLLFCSNSLNAQQAKYQLPPYEKFQLKNGLTVYLMEKHAVPVISLSVIVPAGAVNDGKEAGVASLTAECLRCGTKNYSRQQIEEAFDFAGATLNAYASKEFTIVRTRMAARDEEKLLPIFRELVINPVFTDSIFEKEKKRTVVGLAQAKESPGNVIGLYWDKLFYHDHPYGNITSGTETTVKEIDAQDVRKFHAAFYQPSSSAIAVAGDFKTSEMKKIITSLFGDWQKGREEASAIRSPADPGIDSRVLLVNKEDARETTLIVGSKGLARNNPDYIATQVLNTLFGGRFTSWINDELRIKSGLTYGAFSRFQPLKNGGSFQISTHTANETTAPTLQKITEVLQRVHAGISDTSLTSAKNYMIGLFPPGFQTTDQLSALLTDMFWYGYDKSFINNFEKNVNAVTVEKAERVAADYFPGKSLQIVLIGKADEIRDIAKKYGAVTEVSLDADIGSGY